MSSSGRCWILCFFIKKNLCGTMSHQTNSALSSPWPVRPRTGCLCWSRVLSSFSAGQLTAPKGFGFVDCVAPINQVTSRQGLDPAAFSFFCGTVSPPNEVGFCRQRRPSGHEQGFFEFVDVRTFSQLCSCCSWKCASFAFRHAASSVGVAHR